MGWRFYHKHHESSVAVSFVWLILPISLLVLYTIYKRLIDFFCGENEPKAVDILPVQQSRVKSIAPILTKLPPNFRFANYVNDNESLSSDWPSSAMSLNRVINAPGLHLMCIRCGGDAGSRSGKGVVEHVDLAIPGDERRSSICRQTRKMADVASWLQSQPDVRGSVAVDTARGAALIEIASKQHAAGNRSSWASSSLSTGVNLARTGASTVFSV